MGLDGRPFMMIKFRSMRRDAEKHGPGWTVDNDPRQTKLGKLIRRIEIDELPNLINVFMGEMSLVGPRPEQAHYVEQFRQRVPRYMDRHHEKGGMTGWAQVNGLRGDTSIKERTKYDLWYSEHWSIWLDIKILIRTLWQIVFERHEESPAKEQLSEAIIDRSSLEQITAEEARSHTNGHEFAHNSPEFTSIHQSSPKS
jgi:lipopolysaccharide/colanic/teichoic acid biosynthesis glycosyltransferase